jgi:hypothetical protein
MKNNLYERHLRQTRARIDKEQKLYFENLKNELINKSVLGRPVDEKKENERKILDYVHKYVFLQQLQPVDNSSVKIFKIIKESSRIKFFLRQIILFRDILGSFFGLKSVLVLSSAIFFFFLEYWFHYYSSISLKDVNITIKDIIDKIPPFF